MITALVTCTTQEPPAVTLHLFQALLLKNNLDYGITWRWEGRCRHGIIEVYDASFGPCGGVVESEVFKRNSQSWEESGTVLARMHAGSPKHREVGGLVARLQARSA